MPEEAGTIKVLPIFVRASSLGVAVLYGLKGRSCETAVDRFDTIICVMREESAQIRNSTTFP